MRIQILGLWMLTAMPAAANDCAANVIAIHLQGSQHADLMLLRRAQQSATSIMDLAGIRVIWNTGAPRTADPCCAVAFVLELAVSTPPNFKPEAMAYTFPFQEAGAITIFYDRVRRIRQRPDRVLAHVIAHEVIHMLQGIARHSETGLMKSPWSQEDYHVMLRSTLPLAAEDIDLIRAGLQKRRSAGCGKMPVSTGGQIQ